jgi:GNAT superfamily N-acetyltransferase
MTRESLRSATNLDGNAVRTLVFSVLHEYGLEADPDGVDADMLDIEASYLERGGSFAVLIDSGGEILGSVGLYPVNQRTCELRKMYLVPGARGRGLGKRLIEHALAEAKRLGFSRIELETSSVLQEAIRLYQRYGFLPRSADRSCNRCNESYFLELSHRGDSDVKG